MTQAARKGIRPLSPLTIALLLSLLVVSCAKGGQAATDRPNPKLETASIRVGGRTLLVELAKTEVQRERGLMFRESLEEGKGMLFVFGKDDKLAFWMKNTKIPLALAYLSSDGTIRQIEELLPESLATVSSERSVRYALELPQGWFDRAGVKVGDKVELGEIAAHN